MTDQRPDKRHRPTAPWPTRSAARPTRKLHARRRGSSGVWFGLGMMGLIGWSVAVPTLIGAAIGSWLDSHYPGKHAWTLALLVSGLVLGCFNAWRWIAKEEQRHARRRRITMSMSADAPGLLAGRRRLRLGPDLLRRPVVDGAPGLHSPQPALWFLGSLLLRTAIVLAGFYLVGAGDWRRLLLCLLGLVVGRLLVTRLTRATAAARSAGGGVPCTLAPTSIVFWQHGWLQLNATIVFTWALMLVLALGSLAGYAPAVARSCSARAGRTCWKSS